MGNDKRQNTQPGNSPVTVNYEAYGAKLRYDFSSFSVTSMTSYLNHRESDTLDYGEYIGLPTYPLYERYDGDVSSEEVNVSSNANGSWVWSGGAIYRDGKNFTSQRLAPFATLDWTARSRSYALFGELSHRFLADRLEWTLGARNFHDNVAVEEGHLAAPLNPAFGYYREEDLFDSTTPRAVLTWKPEKDAMVYASYAEGFRSGEPEAYYSVGGVPGFPAVKPDKLHNYEVGAKADLFGGLVSIDTAAYYMKWNDVQQVLLVPFKSTIVSALINGQSASGPGVDLGLTLRLLKGLELVGSVSWNDLTVDRDVISGGAVLFKSGDRLNFSPKSTVSAAASYSFPVGARGFQGRVSASFHSTSAQSARTIAGGRAYITEGDTILLARTSLSVMAPTHWNLSLYADNVTNDQGIVSRNPALGIPLPNWDVRVRPRTVGVQFDYHY
jgi:outer membrane receptor protein involved in Fe transport